MTAAAAQLVLPTPLAEEHADWPFVTVISVNGVSHRTEAVNLRFDGFRWYTGWGYSETASLNDENVTWVRGWHERDSPEVKALKVARRL